jgi:hypothetical protein
VGRNTMVVGGGYACETIFGLEKEEKGKRSLRKT